MDQRIGSSSQPLKGEPVKGAGFDPAFIPGITAPAEPEPADVSPAAGTGTATGPEDAKPAAGTQSGIEDAKPASPEPVAASAEPASAGPGKEPAEESEPEDGAPVFEAADRRARFEADRRGVRLRLDEEACEFHWDEIAAVETESARFGKRFTITVHTPDRRWYPIEIEATSRSRFAEWESQLDAVLDAYFEEA
ncbi:hypothetical protein [Streptomyces sp. 1-11]|uniref:hypothetical protein n=1 Tax=Streptomyces sp. 1-11 TaxID=2590549 RepID=UPI00116E48B4|nr:hypothetical protein [Streptomyces sp. 1-11]GEJ98116.1 hypothetical protein TNCT1_03930 [Streptomyces sp. 1-11]